MDANTKYTEVVIQDNYSHNGHLTTTKASKSTAQSKNGSLSQRNREDFYKKIEISLTARQEKANKIRESQLSEEVKECSFHPEINTLKSKSTLSPSQRLYVNDPRPKLQQIAEINKYKKMEEENMFPYKPQNYCKIKTASKYIKLTKEISQMRKFPKKNLSVQYEEHSFHPKTKDISSKSRLLHSYLSLTPYSRLYENRAAPYKHVHKEGAMSTEIPHDYYNHSTIHALSPDRYKASITSKFYDRLNQYERKKHENREKILEDLTRDITLSPVINKSNEPSIFASSEKSSKVKVAPEQYSFQPEINPKKDPIPKSPEEMAYSPLMHKEEKIQKIKQKIEEEERKQITFKPTINATNTKSKLEYDDPEYLYKLKKEAQKKNEERQKRIIERQAIELNECTHAPKINKKMPCFQPINKQKKKGYSDLHKSKNN